MSEPIQHTDPCPCCRSPRVYMLADDVSPSSPFSWGWACLDCWHRWPGASSGPALISGNGGIHGTLVCPKPCAECPDADHHWLEESFDPVALAENEPQHPVLVYDGEHGTDHVLAHWQCKHCPAWKEYE